MNQQKERHELEITKALECCGNPKIKCFECPFMREEPCTEVLLKSALDLINLKNAEIERLNEEAARFAYYFENAVAAKLKPARAEAIKEFAERVKDEMKSPPTFGMHIVDQIAKEMGVEL